MADTLEIAAKPAGDGMPIGNELTPLIQAEQVTIAPGGTSEPALDDNAAVTVAWMDFRQAQAWLETNSWLAEWQYIDYLKQSPNYDRDWRMQTNRPARISRFNVAKNAQTMSNQVRRGIFAQEVPFVLEPRGKLASQQNAQTYIDAATELLSVLDDRADFEYNMTLLIECQTLQGTGIAIPGWEERKVIKRRRVPKKPPPEIPMPAGEPVKVDTWESDEWKTIEDTVTESWPYFEYRRLGTTFWDEKWNTPNRPDMSATFRVDVDYVNFQDLQQMRGLTCYKDIPDDEELKKFFLANPFGDAEPASQVAQAMNTQSSVVLHAGGEQKNISENPFEKPLMKVAYWTGDRVIEFLSYNGRKKCIRNEEHKIGDHALGYAANWWNIDNSGYGMGIGRLNAGDQRMDQGVLNEVLKMIAFPMNAPILYDSSMGNQPTQNVILGMGTFWGVNTKDGDVNKAFGFMKMPEVPPEAWKIYQLGKDGGEDLVGANSTTMQGNLGGPGSSAMRTAAGVNRVGGKADENISDPIEHLENVIIRWNRFKWEMICEKMPIREIREILSRKFGDAIFETIDAEAFLDMEFEIKVLAGQKLQAKANILQLIPFLLQLVQQPQLLEYMHQKGQTINFAAIEDLFMQMSELQGRQDIIVPLTPQQLQLVQQMNPTMAKTQQAAVIEKLKGQNKIQEIQEQGHQAAQTEVVRAAAKAATEGGGESGPAQNRAEGPTPLELAEARLTRNTDTQLLTGGLQ
jgi:hypothetical protein